MLTAINYIKSGEFTFCSRCGYICHLGKEDFMCTKCVATLFPCGELSKLEIEEKYLYIGIEQEISDILKNYRRNLAKLRNNAELIK